MNTQLPLFKSYTHTLEELYQAVLGCTACPYHTINDRRVNGSGNPGSKLMIVGQGPGKVEIETGHPYVGSSGKLLRTILRKVGIPMSTVYLTNLIRCKSPENKGILTRAIRMCGRWLDDEIGIVEPELIVCLGGLAAKDIMGIESIAGGGGTVGVGRLGIPSIATWHTAYLLRIKSRDKVEYARLANESMEHWRSVAEYVEASP